MLLSLQKVKYELGSRVLFDDVNWSIFPGERIGLVGFNGTGKSTMLKLMVNAISPSGGQISKGKDTTIGYLHQDLMSQVLEQSITEVVLGAFEKAMLLKAELDIMEANPNLGEDEALLEKYTELIGDFSELDGYNLEHKAEEVLAGLGFEAKDMGRSYNTFSGGWRMRVLLAKMILQSPDLLLLDEPTNHLDLPSIEWLEKYLITYPGAVVVVSHDKYFLNKMCNKIVEVYQRKVNFYTGNYDFYENEKELRNDVQLRAFENQQDYIRQQERFIERFKAKASKAAQAQSAMKRLDKLDVIEDVVIERPNLRINFSTARRPGKIIAKLENIYKSYGDLHIIKNGTLEVERGDKIALVGANGKGKSTLMRLVAATEGFDSGERSGWHNVDEAFYAQHQIESLKLSNSVLQELAESGNGKNDLELRSLLGCFLFSGDDSDKKISVLSGGEKARVALAKVIASKANFLLLDEPTNHLDLPSVELLIEALNKYEGTFIIVSHDRYFVSKCANKIWEIVDGEIKEFKGTYDEWLEWNKRMADQGRSKPAETAKQEQSKQEIPKPKQEVAAPNKPINKDNTREISRLQKLLEKTETELNALKLVQTQLETDMAHPDAYKDPNSFKLLEKKYSDQKLAVFVKEKDYEQIFEELMNAEEN
jgi:ATP-binding cassette, subfamily F, member 3